MVRRISSPSGFSLIELLVVVLIVGLLATIMIPRFLGQRDSSNDASAKSALRNAAAAAEAHYLQREDYVSSAAAAQAICSSEPGLTIAGLESSGTRDCSLSTPDDPFNPSTCGSPSRCVPGSNANPNLVWVKTAGSGKSSSLQLCNVSRGAKAYCMLLRGAAAPYSSVDSSLSSSAAGTGSSSSWTGSGSSASNLLTPVVASAETSSGWVCSPTPCTATYTTAQAQAGQQSALITANAPTFTYLQGGIWYLGVSPGQTFRASAWIMRAAGSSATMRCQSYVGFFTAGGAWISSFYSASAITPSTSAWQQMSMSNYVTAPANTGKLWAGVGCNYNLLGDQIYVDNVLLEQGP